jgi:thiamine biosynthesis protein ThiC
LSIDGKTGTNSTRIFAKSAENTADPDKLMKRDNEMTEARNNFPPRKLLEFFTTTARIRRNYSANAMEDFRLLPRSSH